jgi:glyoxylate/hydroxypyruvate reductase A
MVSRYPEYLDPAKWRRNLALQIEGLDFRVWPDVGKNEDILLVLADFAPPGLFRSLRNLRCICKLGAGMDALFEDPDLPEIVPIVRLQDPTIASQVVEYIVLYVLSRHRHLEIYRRQQLERTWHPIPTRVTSEVIISLLGMGRIGAKAAEIFQRLGFAVKGWSRTAKKIAGVECLFGEGTLTDVIGDADYVICALPLTPETRGICDRRFFEAMKPGAWFINVGRGGHVNEVDLQTALESRQLAGATLDVFSTEPLPKNHPLWAHPKVTITPHVANFWLDGGIDEVAQLYRRLLAGCSPQNVVDKSLGY